MAKATTAKTKHDDDLEEREVAYAVVVREFRSKCREPINGERKIVFREVFERTLGKLDKGHWAHRTSWGDSTPDDDGQGNDANAGGERPNSALDDQRKFRRHMMQLARCMGIEAEHDRKGGRLTGPVMRAAMIKVMVRSFKSRCYPMQSAADGGVCTVDETEPEASSESALLRVAPRVCGEFLREEGQI